MATDSDLHCLFTAPVEEHDDSYVIEIPKQEVELGTLAPETLYRIALFHSDVVPPQSESESRSQPQSRSESEPQPQARPEQSESRSDEPTGEPEFAPTGPPVAEGETRVVEIDNIGDKGDGVARIDGGYVVIVSDAEVGERLRVEMEQVRENVAFAEVVERLPYYE
ncbi:deoxyribonuclease [Haloarcula mannanilytica]|uniref:Deoxyribonuclease n=1 Tax=Haloarcula mannanilytica TaxID=2509225 RepID=A0A4C2EME9_9EURY|nr:TRAM domain-containing protein [Haloarcula mannanilytica]GCF15515.1 deoxyribonuclease [Haloarcula mannanilytica]